MAKLRTRLLPLLVVLLALAMVAAACGGDDDAEADTTTTTASSDTTEGSTETTEGSSETTEAPMDVPEKIVIGNPIALSGANAGAAALTQIPAYDLWVNDVNADGGIYVAEYDAKIPVEILRYDDTSDIGTAVTLVEKLIVEDEVDFLFPPWGTAFNFAIAPIISDYEMPVSGCTVGSNDLVDKAAEFPYFFTLLNQAQAQGTALVEVLVELGIEDVAVIHHDDLHGIEFAEVVVPQLEAAGIEIKLNKTYPLGTEDLTQLLREVEGEDPDALLAFSYPPETFLMTGNMIEIGYSPDLFFATVGVAFPPYRDAIFSPEIVEGVMGTGVWNPNVPVDGAKDMFDRWVAFHDGGEPDRWASAACYATGEVLQQAIEQAGTLDPVAVRDAMTTGSFETVLGTVTFDNQINYTYPGAVGQWQNGEFEVIGPTDQATVDPIYPKPAWPSG